MLTDKQEQFCRNIIEGMSQADAYRQAYPNNNMADKTIQENACRLAKKPAVKARIKELRDQLAKPTIMTAQERLEYLTRVIKGEEPEKEAHIVEGELIEYDVPSSIKTRLNALDIMNKMQGEYVQKIEADVASEVNIRIELSED